MIRKMLGAMIFASIANKEDLRSRWKNHFHDRTLPDRAAVNAKFKVNQSADGSTAEILLYDEIGYWGVNAKDFATQLAGVTASSITVRINSPGGDVFDGLAMFASLQAHPATINTVVEGWAASAASFIALAGDTVTMAENSFMMIHKAWGVAVGNQTDMTEMSSVLGKIDGQLAAIYSKKTGKSVDDILSLMAGETDGTWFTAQEAKDIGLADSIVGQVEEDPAGDPEDVSAALTDRVKNMRRRVALAHHE